MRQSFVDLDNGILYRLPIGKLALEHRLATCVWSSDTLKAGALLSYGPNLVAICRRTGALVQKIIKGEKPAEIPVGRPTKFELGVHLKTAKALGITISPSLLATADEVIEWRSFAAMHEAAIGPTRTFRQSPSMSAFEGKAATVSRSRHVRL